MTTDPAGLPEARRQRHRLRMTLIGVGNAALQALVVLLFAATGTVGWALAVSFAAVLLGTTVTFSVAVASGWNLRRRDPNLVVPQMGASFVLQLTFLVIEPRLWVLYLVAVLVTFTFAMASFTPRQFRAGLVAVAAGLAVALVAVRDRFGHIGTSGAEIALIWLFFVLAVHQMTVIGGRFSALRAQLSARNRELSVALEQLRTLATVDDLTGVANRRALMTAVTAEQARAERDGRPFGVAILDVDRFKEVNDTHGHATGDVVLAELAAVASRDVRAADLFARFGGEEFALLLTAPTTPAAATTAVERIRAAVEAHRFDAVADGHGVTVSAGVACWRPGDTAESLLARADGRLYEAKAGGRNRTVAGAAVVGATRST